MPAVAVYTATAERPDIASVWHAAIKATLRNDNKTVICYQGEPPQAGDEAIQIPELGFMAMDYVQRVVMPNSGLRVYLEEDMIPVRSWSPDDYPGDYRIAEGYPGVAWPSAVIARRPYRIGMPQSLIPQRFVRNGGCPDWLPSELCEPALAANAQVLGEHFLHIDKAYRPSVPEAAEKLKLLEILRERYAAHAADHPPRLVELGVESGPGTELKKLLATIGITASPTCSCNERARIMDERGVQWCEDNVDKIVGWLREEATKRKLPFFDFAGRSLVNLAIRRAKRGNRK